MASPNISEIASTTLRNYAPAIQDAASNNVALLSFLKEKGKIRKLDGGDDILQHLEYALNGTAAWYSGYDNLDITPQDVITSSNWDWKQANVNVVYSGLEAEVQNTGRERLKDLVEVRTENAKRAIIDLVEAGLFSDGTGAGGKQLGGLQLIVADTPGSATVGGISDATYTWWQNNTFDCSTDGGAAMSSSNARSYMNKALLEVIRGKERPHAGFADDNYYNFFEESLQAIQRISDPRVGKSGFENLVYKGIPIVLAGGQGGKISSNHLYFLNFDYLYFCVHKNRYFMPDEKRDAINQDACVIPMWFAGALTCSNREMQTVIIA